VCLGSDAEVDTDQLESRVSQWLLSFEIISS
jgi:hypothetical protein